MQQLFLQSSMLSNAFFPIAMIGVLVYMIWSQRSKQKQQSTFMDGLKKGDKVVTSSGMLGTIDKVEDKTVQLNVGNRTFIQVTKNAISKELTDAVYPQVVDKP